MTQDEMWQKMSDVRRKMTQDELWLKKYQEIITFIETNHRNPSKHNPEERYKYCNWIKHNEIHADVRRLAAGFIGSNLIK